MIASDGCGLVELSLAKSRFAEVADHWGLDAAEAAALLGLAACDPDLDLLAGTMTVEVETRLRLVTEVARGLDRIFDPPVLLEWLRDDEDDEVTPLAFMSRGVTELRAMRAAAAARAA